MKRIVCGIAVALVAGAVHAQVPAKPASPATDETRLEMLRQVLQPPTGAMAPAMEQMTDAMIESQLKAAERPDTARRIAIFKKNLYDALQAQGFSKADALAITQVTPLPSAAPGAR
jgi:hypothetical protein